MDGKRIWIEVEKNIEENRQMSISLAINVPSLFLLITNCFSVNHCPYLNRTLHSQMAICHQKVPFQELEGATVRVPISVSTKQSTAMAQ